MAKLFAYILLILAVAGVGQTEARTIEFAGMSWTVKNGYAGPGPNFWSDSTDSVWVDAQGRLHMKIRQIGGTWYCSEVICQEDFGYSRYTVKMSSNPELFDRNAVVGFFTYKSDTEEIDIEFTKWGSTTDPNTGQFAVQPSTPNTSSRVRFLTGLTGTNPQSTHHFTWDTDYIYFQSYHGHSDELDDPEDLIREHTYTGGNIPPLSDATFRINFWMFQGNTPSGEMELIIDDVIIADVSECEVAGDCDDGLYCNGQETCVDHTCQSGTAPCGGPQQVCDEVNDECVCDLEAWLRAEELWWFPPCVLGPNVDAGLSCLCGDRDEDGDVDLNDFALVARALRESELLFDFESGAQGWSSFGVGTISSGITAEGSIGNGRFHTINFSDAGMTWGAGDKSPDGVDLSAYSGMSIDARLTSYDLANPFVGTPIMEFMLSIGYMEWAEEVTLSENYQRFAVDFADLVPQGTATQPVTHSQLSNPGMRVKLIMRKAGKSGKAKLEYDQFSGLP